MLVLINLFTAAINLGIYFHSSDPMLINLIAGLLSLFIGLTIAIMD